LVVVVHSQAGPASAATSQSKTVAAVVSAARIESVRCHVLGQCDGRYECLAAAQRNGRRCFSFPMHSGRSAWMQGSKSGRTPKLLSPIKSVQDPVLLRRCCHAGVGVVHDIFSCQTPWGGGGTGMSVLLPVRLALIRTDFYCFYSVFVSMDCNCCSPNSWL
jgi:hypothetical protein